eukprot:TRINITY_DN950_c0_g1_i5.p1 TRINITY_DN950_c0_g1~~TRINITY_DN950_c0_g1_i5.p1  ORF type:complete len:947 (+),score=188.27 TRINITY_DN950_c0_g1_i5:51-2891(+)
MAGERASDGGEEGSDMVEPPDAQKQGRPAPSDVPEFASAEFAAVYEYLHTSERGLSSEDAHDRLALYGPNALPSESESRILKFLSFLWNPLSWAMEVAFLMAVVLTDAVDAFLILFLLLLNACIGYYEEHSSGEAVKALQAQLEAQCTVRRDNQWTELPARDLVPGDIVKLHIGGVVPADCKMLPGDSMSVDESSLTGESLPVKKCTGDELKSGCMVKVGGCDAVVFATGSNTYFGKAAKLVQGTEGSGHFQKVLKRIGYGCIVLIVIFVVLELIVQFGVRRKPCTGVLEGQCTSLSNTLVLIVGGIPVAMPTVLSVTMAIGAAYLAKEKALVTRLTAIEELAGMDVLCSDKTGTLTLNELSVTEPIPLAEGITPEEVLRVAVLASQSEFHDPMDHAILNANPTLTEATNGSYTLYHFTPFDPVSKRTVARVAETGGGETKQFRACKGAPWVILDQSSNKDVVAAGYEHIEALGAKGYRALGVCKSENLDGEDTWITLGLIPLFDPPRVDTEETIRRATELGIRVKMITGDHLTIAKETCRMLKMGDNVLAGSALIETSEKDRFALCESTDGFAGVFPEHKYEIVKILQQKQGSVQHVVGMTGDGVNDAPALAKADIGIAVADATDAARGASDIVLLSPGLGVIINAIIASRKIFQRMRNYAIYSIASTVRIVLTFGLLTLIFDYMFPTLVIAIMAILNDGAVLTISKDAVKPSPTPDHWNLRRIFFTSFALGLWNTAASLLLFCLVQYTLVFQVFSMPVLDHAQLRGLIYLHCSISGQITIFATRAVPGYFWQTRPSKLLLAAFFVAQIIASAVGGVGFFYYPMDGETDFAGCGWSYVIFAWLYSVAWFMAMGPYKNLAHGIGTRLFEHGEEEMRPEGPRTRSHPVYGRVGGFFHFNLRNVWPSLRVADHSVQEVSSRGEDVPRTSFEELPRPPPPRNSLDVVPV